MDAEFLGFGSESIIIYDPSCLMQWVIVLTPGDKLNRQLTVGLDVTTSSILFFIVNGFVIACLSYDCIPR